MCLVASLSLTINGLRFGCSYATAGKQLASKERRTGEKNVVSRAVGGTGSEEQFQQVSKEKDQEPRHIQSQRGWDLKDECVMTLISIQCVYPCGHCFLQSVAVPRKPAGAMRDGATRSLMGEEETNRRCERRNLAVRSTKPPRRTRFGPSFRGIPSFGKR